MYDNSICVNYSRYNGLKYLSHQFSILSMDPCYGANVLAVLQGLEELTVPQHVHVLIGHEHLKGIHSFLPHQLLHLSAHLHGRESVNILKVSLCTAESRSE